MVLLQLGYLSPCCWAGRGVSSSDSAKLWQLVGLMKGFSLGA